MADEGDAVNGGKRFGEYLAKLRTDAGKSQSAAVAEAGRATGTGFLSLTQASLARLELGQTAAKPDTLLALAQLYDVPFDRMISAYVSIVMFGQEVPKHFSWPRNGVPNDQPLDEQPFFASNRLEAWSLAEVLAWEEGIARGDSPRGLWIISTRFVDHTNSRISDIIVELLVAGAKITYFVNSDIGFGTPFDLLLNTVVLKLRKQLGPEKRGQIGEIALYKLNPFEQVMFTSSLVIGNPDNLDAMRDKPCGFTIVSAGGEHQFGIPLQHDEARHVVDQVRVQIELRLSDARYGEWHPHALTGHNLFKREFENG